MSKIRPLKEKLVPPSYPPFFGCKVEEYTYTDFSTKHGAEVLCERIMAAWRKVGYEDVVAWTVASPVIVHEHARVDVRTNLIAGWPPSVRARMSS